MEGNKGVYELFTDPTFLGFYEFLKVKHIKLEDLQDKTEFYKQVAYYVHGIEFHLIDWFENYNNAG